MTAVSRDTWLMISQTSKSRGGVSLIKWVWGNAGNETQNLIALFSFVV